MTKRRVILIKEMRLDSVEALSLVDKGASGDDQARPSILMWKRAGFEPEEKETMPKKALPSATEILKLSKMSLGEVTKALIELDLGDKLDPVLALIEQAAGAGKEAAKPDAPAEMPKVEGDPEEEKPAEEMEKAEGDEDKEKEEMAKRAKTDKAHALELKKRDDENKTLKKRLDVIEEEATTLRMEKRADELGFIPGYDHDELLELCKQADGNEKMNATLDKLAKTVKESPVLKAAGLITQDDENSATMKLQKRVDTYRDQNPGKTEAESKAVVWKANKKLYAEAKAEQN